MQPCLTSSAPFETVEAAWFAASRSIRAGTSPDVQTVGIIRCLDRLYRNRRIELLHARILRIWGGRGMAPNPKRPRERSDWQIWCEAIERMDGPLRAQGIVGPMN